jgi:hypothetical protein
MHGELHQEAAEKRTGQAVAGSPFLVPITIAQNNIP